MGRGPDAASATALAAVPPSGLDGLDPSFSRLVAVPEAAASGETTATAVERTWHVLDNAAHLERLGVRSVGTILCVHGNPTWSYLWRRLVSAATDAAAAGQDAWRVVAVDQLEMGFSERTGGPRPLPRRVRDLGDLTAALGLEGPVVTLGHDWGGVISLGWAVDHPEQLAAVVLLNTAVHQPADSAIPAPLRVALQPGVLGAATVSTPAFVETTLALARPPLPRAVKDGYRAPYRTAARRGGIGGFVADIPVDAAHPSTPELDRIAAGVRDLDVPALLLWGPDDPIFSDRYLDDLLDRLPHADVHRFEGAGHLVAEDVDYVSAVLTWLSERAGRTPAGSADPPAWGEREQPLWRSLERLADSRETALVEMAPAAGPAPRVVSWRLLSRRVTELAAGLHRIGIARGDRVLLLVPPGADLTAALYACVRIGAVVVVADAGLGVRGLTRAVRGAQPDHVIGSLQGLAAARALRWPGRRISAVPLPPAVARTLGVTHSLSDLVALGTGGDLPAEPGPSDTAAVLFTSGSTGPAKGVVYTHGQLSAACRALADRYGLGPGAGLVAGFAPFALLAPGLGARTAIPAMDVTSPATLTATAVAQAAAAGDATVVFLSPAALANVVATADGCSPADRAALGRVRTFLSAGAPVPPALLAAAGRLMPHAVPHTPYGMTECLLVTDITLEEITAASAGEDGPGGACVGTPVRDTRVMISALDADGLAVGEPSTTPRVTGEVVVCAPHLKAGYDRLHLTDRASTRGLPAGAERWHRTGDVGHLDDDGRLWVEGRLAHVAVTAAGVVTPVGLEQHIESVPSVERAGVVGVGPRGTQVLVAVVEQPGLPRPARLAPPALAAAVRASVSRPLAAVLVVRRLPTDVRHNSKIDRIRLAAWAQGVLAGGPLRRP